MPSDPSANSASGEQPSETRRPAPLVVARLPRRIPHPVQIEPGAEWRAEMIEELGLIALRKVALRGQLEPEGQSDWRLTARLGATVVQPCVVTAAPVTTRIETVVLRRFLSNLPPPPPGESESPEDDTIEPLGPVIELDAILQEALALALPDYPRAPDAPEPAEPSTVSEAEDEEAAPNPFAVLARLKPPPGGSAG